MAARYWVGGTGNWTDTAKWSTSSGGGGGASVPTISDDVIINGSSGSPVISLSANQDCLSLNTTGATCTIKSSTTTVREILVYGNITLESTTTFEGTSGPARPRVKASSTVSITNAKLNSDIFFDAAGATFTVSGALTIGSSTETFSGIFRKNINVSAGTFTTNNNTITAYNFFAFGTSTINLGSSTVNLISIVSIATGVTLNAGTSTINCIYFTSFSGAGKTYNVVNLTCTGTGLTLNGANIFNNLTLSNQVAISHVTITANQTVTGTFSATSNANTKRLRVVTAQFTTQYTITAAVTTLSYVDFRSIIAAGAAAWTGTSVGNAGNNSGITFTAAVNRYGKVANGGTGGFTTIGWAATSGGASGASIPIPQDNVFFDSAAGAGTYGAEGLICSTLNCSGFTQTLKSGADFLLSGITVLGNITFPNTDSSNAYVSAVGTGSSTITGGSGRIRSVRIGNSDYNNPAITYSLTGNTTFIDFTLDYGTLNAGSGTLTLTNNFNVNNAAFIYNKQTSNIVITAVDAIKNFKGGGLTYPKITIVVTYSGALVAFSGNNRIDELATTTTLPLDISFAAGSKTTFGAFTVSGIAGAITTIRSSSSTRAILSKTSPWRVGVNSTTIRSSGINLVAGDGIDYLAFEDITALPNSASFLIMF